MGVYYETLLTITSQNIEFLERFFKAVLPKPEPTMLQKITNIISRREHVSSCGLMGYLLPMPQHLEKTVTNGYNGASPEWRNWRNENWGAPVDVGLDLCDRINNHEIRMHFTSYNGDLVIGLTTASRTHGFSFKMLYHCDHGVVGHCTENSHTSFEFPGEQSPVESGIPNELIESFNLNEAYTAYAEDR